MRFSERYPVVLATAYLIFIARFPVASQLQSDTTKQELLLAQPTTEDELASDAYLKIEGINGESDDERHKNWIEVHDVLYAIHQPRADALSTAGGLTTGRADLYPINFSKLADLASPILLQTCAAGKTLPKACFEFMRADGDGKPIRYFRIELENLIIASITPDSGEGGIIVERVQLAYAKIKWHYLKQSIRGGTQGNTQGGWDCSAHKIC